MTEKVCQLYEEEQVGKTWEGRKTVPTSKMPDLGWDIAEAQLQETQEKPENNDTHTAPCFQLLITLAIIITAIVEQIAVYVREITKKTAQAVKSMTMEASLNKLIQNIKDSYKTERPVRGIIQIARSSMKHSMETTQPTQACENLMTSMANCTRCTHPRSTTTVATSTTSCKTAPANCTQRPDTKTETPKHKTLNSALVPTNKVLNTTWKLSEDHTPSHT